MRAGKRAVSALSRQKEKKRDRDERARNSLDKVAPGNTGAGGGQKGSGVVGTDMPRIFFRKGRRIPVAV